MDCIPSDAALKQCSQCPRVLPATREFFYADKRATDGLQSVCKDCRKRYNQENKESIREQQRLYYQEHREQKLLYQRLYQQEHKDHVHKYKRWYYQERKEWTLLRSKQYQQSHKDQRREYLKHYQSTHREQHNLINKKYRDGHREQCYDRQKKWAQTERGRLIRRAIDHKRRALEVAADGRYTSDQLRDQKACQKNKCYYCKKELGNTWHADHVVPLSRGGSNAIHNIVITCPACNWRKSNKLPHEFPEGGRLM